MSLDAGRSRVGVLDYGLGNPGSVINMLRWIDAEAEVVAERCEVTEFTHYILPGVGAFDAGIENLRKRGLDSFVAELADNRVPVLGVCLGMQMLFEGSDEGELLGLGILPGRCRALREVSTMARFPHMGWGETRWPTSVDHPEQMKRFYYAHSFAVPLGDADDGVLATCDYGYEFSAVVARQSVVGSQFHPEKSHHFGMAFLGRFLEGSL